MSTSNVIKVLRTMNAGFSPAVAVLLLIGIISFSSCSDDSDDVVPSNEREEIIELTSDTLAVSFSYAEADYELVLLQAEEVKVGVNAVYAYLLQKTEDGLVAVGHPEDYTIGVYPFMPGMGHSSPNNQDFVWNTEKQAYQGTLNFTMSGLWQIFLTLRYNEEVIAEDIYWTLQLGSMSM